MNTAPPSNIVESGELNGSARSVNSAIATLYSGILKSLGGRYLGYGVQVISLMVLARIFTPREYGVVASVQVFYVFFQMIADMGLGAAIINIRNASDREIGGIFSVTIALGFGLLISFWALSGAFQHFYSIAEISKVVPLLAGGLFFYACAIVPTASLNREMYFFDIAKATAIAEIISATLAIILQFRVDPIVALASKALIAGFTQFVCVYMFSRKTEFGWVRPVLNLSGMRKILWFSTYQLAFSFVNYFARNLDNILVGRFMGSVSLGVYDKAYQLMKYPLLLLTFGMTPAIQPALAKHSGDPAFCEKIHRDFVTKLSWLGLAAGLFVVLGAAVIVRVILGPRWSSVTPIIRQLGLAVPVQVIVSSSGSFYQAMNRPDLLFVTCLCSSIPVISAIAVGIWQRDLVLMSWLLSASFNLCAFLSYFVLYKYVFRVSPRIFYHRMRFQISINLLILAVGSPFVLRLLPFLLTAKSL